MEEQNISTNLLPTCSTANTAC